MTADTRNHAVVGASSAYRWLVCTPSARLEDALPDRKSEAADEGTFAHAVAEYCLTRGIPVAALCGVPEFEDSRFWTKDLQEYVQEYVSRCVALIKEVRQQCPDAAVFIEARLNLERIIPEGFGTGDLVIIADGTGHIVDLKFGKGKPVFAPGNPQTRLYGVGVLDGYGHLYDIQRVRMVIDQPRINNYSEETLSAVELLAWADSIKPAAKAAFCGDGERVAGEHCDFCRARAQCDALAEFNLQTARLEFAEFPGSAVPESPPGLLSLEQLAALLPRLEALKKWATEVQDFALAKALDGEMVPGYKLVEGRTVRRYGDADAVAARLVSHGLNESQIYERALVTITALEKILGKKKFADLLGDLLVRSDGKPTLVPEADKRPALNSLAAAAADFADPHTEE